MGDDGPDKIPPPPAEDKDAEARVKLLENGATKKPDGGMAAADRIERENGETERKVISGHDRHQMKTRPKSVTCGATTDIEPSS